MSLKVEVTTQEVQPKLEPESESYTDTSGHTSTFCPGVILLYKVYFKYNDEANSQDSTQSL